MNAIVAFPTPAEKTLGEQFRALQAKNASDPARERAYAAFSAAGLPHRRIEAWHYTDLRGMLRDVLPPASMPDAASIEGARSFLQSLPDTAASRIVLLDGMFVSELSDLSALGDKVEVRSVLDQAAADRLTPAVLAAEKLGAPESLVFLNAALLQGGISIRLQPGTKVEAPIEILSILSGKVPSAAYTRSYIDLGEHASATIVERHAVLGSAKTQGQHVLVFALGDGASLEHAAKLEVPG